MNKQPVEKYLLLFVPFGLSVLFTADPIVAYLIAWFGSFLIFYLSMSGWLKPIPTDRTFAEQLMRPLFLPQIIFAGYMACSSIFYFMDVFGYENFHKSSNTYFFVDQERLSLTAQCQQYYVLGHAAFVTGISVFMKYPVKQKYHIEAEKLANLLMVTAFISLAMSFVFLNTEGLKQLYFQYNTLSFIAGTLALAYAIPLKKIWNTIFCLGLYLSNFYQALTSGFKEPIIVSVMVLGIFLYPNYKKLVLILFGPALIVLFLLLPIFNQAFRQSNWADDVSAADAYNVALDATINTDQSDQGTTWVFLVDRLSEIDMFTKFIQSTPKFINYYGFTIFKQSAIAVIPRIFWESKPITETLVMQRVFDAGITGEGSTVSAKPAVIVDAYLTGGILGIVSILFLYGAAAQLICLRAEYLFGGYNLGAALIFSGLFQMFWRGLSLEFLINSVIWSFVTMLVIFQILRGIGMLTKD